MNLRLSSAVFLLALIAPAFASPAPIEAATSTLPKKLYLGVLVGGGSSNTFNAGQFGTAYYTEAAGGPLAVNAFGHLNSRSASFFGAQMGYETEGIPLNPSSPWTLGPAAEMEGYYLSSSTFSGTLSNNTVRLDEHDFSVSYPMSRTVFLVNAVLNFNSTRLPVHPYIGFGLGDAIVRISGANAAQTNPAEVGVNHYNASTSDTDTPFAGQIKLGLSFDFNKYVSLFADYRWLYLASSHYIFGSTVSTGHVETSSWQVKLDAQRYNMGNIGIRFKL
jgi:hypothetical protein